MAKLKVMNSTIGFRPYIAAPTPRPVNPACKHTSPHINRQHTSVNYENRTLNKSRKSIILETRKRQQQTFLQARQDETKEGKEPKSLHTSVIGVSKTRSGPNFCNRPFVTCQQPNRQVRHNFTPDCLFHSFVGRQLPKPGTNQTTQNSTDAKVDERTL